MQRESGQEQVFELLLVNIFRKYIVQNFDEQFTIFFTSKAIDTTFNKKADKRQVVL